MNPTRGRKENRIRRNERKRRRTTTTTKKRDGARSSDETNQKLEKRDVISVSTCPFPSRLGRARAARTKKKKKKKKTPHSCRKAPRFSHHRTPTKTRTKERGGRRTSSLSLSLSVSCESCLPNFFISLFGEKILQFTHKEEEEEKIELCPWFERQLLRADDDVSWWWRRFRATRSREFLFLFFFFYFVFGFLCCW